MCKTGQFLQLWNYEAELDPVGANSKKCCFLYFYSDLKCCVNFDVVFKSLKWSNARYGKDSDLSIVEDKQKHMNISSIEHCLLHRLIEVVIILLNHT